MRTALLTPFLAIALALPHLALAEEDPEAEFTALKQLLIDLPEPPKAAHREAVIPQDMVQFAPHISVKPGFGVALDATCIFDKGPIDGLEVLLCLTGGKNHEAFAYTKTSNAELVKGAFILGMNLEDGQSSEEESGFPARGTPLRIRVQWQPDVFMDPDRWVEVDGSQLVRDRSTDRSYPMLPYVYTGSQIRTIEEMLPDGSTVRRESFMLATTKSLAVNFDEPDTLIASPSPLAARDQIFEVNSAVAPRKDTPVRFIFQRAELPLTLVMNAQGELLINEQRANDDALVAALQKAFGAAKEPIMHAIGVVVDPNTDRSHDLNARKRLLKLAGAAGVWAVPMFVLPASK